VLKYSLGIIGYPLGHTLSPFMHKAVAHELGLELQYKSFEVNPKALGDFMKRFRDTSLDGINVTVPHKVAVMEFLDGLTDEAITIGAVNTIYRKDNKLIGDNTDGFGFIESLHQNARVDPSGKSIFVYGAGGAARAIVTSLAGYKAKKIVIANRTYKKAEKLAVKAKELGCVVDCISNEDSKLIGSIRAADIIVNSTSIGMEGVDEKELPGISGIGPSSLAVDIVYRPLRTKFLVKADSIGAVTLDGLWMLIHQGARSFFRWTGREFPTQLARSVLLTRLSNN